jgi:putative aldouronate transport system substrate-binding protein
MISRRTFLAAAAGSATTSLVVACGGSGSTPAATGALTAMAPLLGTQAPGASNPMVAAVNKLIGQPLNVTWVPNSSYADKTNVLLASGQTPQIMVIQGRTPAFVKAAQAGAFWELTGRLADYPNLASPNPMIERASSVNGKLYGLYRARDAMRACVILRKDWLDKLGLAVPTTTQELYQVARAFAEGDPNGGGGKDTYGIVIPAWAGGLWSGSPYDLIETWYGAPNRWALVDGGLVPSFETEAFLEANAWVKKMIDEGLINKDFATFDSGKWNEPFLNGRAGIIIDTGSRALALLGLFKQKYPQDYGTYVAIAGNLVGPDGQKHSYPTDGYSGLVAFSKSTVRTEKDLKVVLTVMDRLSQRDGQILLTNGIEGQNFTLRDGAGYELTPPTDQGKSVGDAVKAYAQLGTHAPKDLFHPIGLAGGADQALVARRTALAREDLQTAVYDPTAAYLSETFVTKGAQLGNIISDARIRYLAGQLDLAGLKRAIALWGSSGGAQVKRELADLYQKNAG